MRHSWLRMSHTFGHRVRLPCWIQQQFVSGTLLDLLACPSSRAAGLHFTWSSTRVCVAGEVHAEAVDQSNISRLKLLQ